MALGSATTLSGQLSALTSGGYDIANVGGDKDGYDNVTAHVKLRSTPSASTDLLLVARYTSSNSEFDGFDYTAGVPSDEPLATRSKQFALRAEAGIALLDDRHIDRRIAVQLQHPLDPPDRRSLRGILRRQHVAHAAHRLD